MKLAFTLLDWQASAPGLSETTDWQQWASRPLQMDASLPMGKARYLPMMTARRLTGGSRAAVDSGLAIMQRQRVDAVVFSSRHGELERNLRILTALQRQESLSPTDFAMSVHNSAVGSLTIAAAAPVMSTSLSAGADTFQQALVEVTALHSAGYQQVLLVDSEGAIPEFYQPHLPAGAMRSPYAVALLLGQGDNLCCQSATSVNAPDVMPQSLLFLHAWLARVAAFTINGERLIWRWACRYE
ncbi:MULTISPECIES: beta-ketoacyl synthase chain length factor [Erwinia]|uniref:beta-ketoacyl synthase chain length factor n=1 Tax=Erwinia TaxID=551 RepID=UPI000556D22D|nr:MULTISPECIES: beta-ketoacyl synthase chain length factor [Erwinia]